MKGDRTSESCGVRRKEQKTQQRIRQLRLDECAKQLNLDKFCRVRPSKVNQKEPAQEQELTPRISKDNALIEPYVPRVDKGRDALIEPKEIIIISKTICVYVKRVVPDEDGFLCAQEHLAIVRWFYVQFWP